MTLPRLKVMVERVPAVDQMLVDRFPGRSRPALATSAVLRHSPTRIRSAWLRGSIYWVLRIGARGIHLRTHQSGESEEHPLSHCPKMLTVRFPSMDSWAN